MGLAIRSYPIAVPKHSPTVCTCLRPMLLGAHLLKNHDHVGPQYSLSTAGKRSASRSMTSCYRASKRALYNASQSALQRALMRAYLRAIYRASQRAVANARYRAYRHAWGHAFVNAVMVRDEQRVITPSASRSRTRSTTPVERGMARPSKRLTTRGRQGVDSRDLLCVNWGVQPRPYLSVLTRDVQRGYRAYETALWAARVTALRRAVESALDRTRCGATMSAWASALNKAQPTRGVSRIAARVETR